ncbi:hypothetical protein [Nocardioides speluncae]|uniref:hypothetical protein n=1 Tax=Nocardioides speluncae TaxID=2670337 RepID=UPI0012B16317|nr:hypothetical protein [Nocardioides speluncae]
MRIRLGVGECLVDDGVLAYRDHCSVPTKDPELRRSEVGGEPDDGGVLHVGSADAERAGDVLGDGARSTRRAGRAKELGGRATAPCRRSR